MITNDVLRSLRYSLQLSATKIRNLMKGEGYETTAETVTSWLSKEDESDFRECPDAALMAFLDGLITHFRGPAPESAAKPPIKEGFSNNLVLRKIRIALQLKDDDIINILSAAQLRISKPELSALFRQKDHKNYRICGDQFLRNFLKGLARVKRPNTQTDKKPNH